MVEQDVAKHSKEIIELFLYDGRYVFIKRRASKPSQDRAPKLTDSNFRKLEMKAPRRIPTEDSDTSEETPEDPGISEDDKIDIENYFFQSEFSQFETFSESDDSSIVFRQIPNLVKKKKVFIKSRVLPYRVKFSTDVIMTQIDNSIMFGNYQNISTGTPLFGYPSLSPFIKAGITDLMEDYRIVGGLRVPFGFDGIEYFLTYENKKERLDKRLMYYRGSKKTELLFLDVARDELFLIEGKEKNSILQLSLIWPLDVVKSFRGHISYRNDKFISIAIDTLRLNIPNSYENWASFRMEYVYDNTLKQAINILHGTRYKVYWELQQQFRIPLVQSKPDLFSNNIGYFSAIGFDFRHYQKIRVKQLGEPIPLIADVPAE
ncbi:MAG: hypothetical protein IH946_03730, partial [Bacteroidetes bacterium]|nr:hypothetical protein [Bacteroidota bacterium]